MALATAPRHQCSCVMKPRKVRATYDDEVVEEHSHRAKSRTNEQGSAWIPTTGRVALLALVVVWQVYTTGRLGAYGMHLVESRDRHEELQQELSGAQRALEALRNNTQRCDAAAKEHAAALASADKERKALQFKLEEVTELNGWLNSTASAREASLRMEQSKRLSLEGSVQSLKEQMNLMQGQLYSTQRSSPRRPRHAHATPARALSRVFRRRSLRSHRANGGSTAASAAATVMLAPCCSSLDSSGIVCFGLSHRVCTLRICSTGSPRNSSKGNCTAAGTKDTTSERTSEAVVHERLRYDDSPPACGFVLRACVKLVLLFLTGRMAWVKHCALQSFTCVMLCMHVVRARDAASLCISGVGMW